MGEDEVTTMWECDLMEKIYLCGLDSTQEPATIKAWRSSHAYHWESYKGHRFSTQALSKNDLAVKVMETIRGWKNE